MMWMKTNREVLTVVLALGIASSAAAATGAQSQSQEATTPSSAPPVLFHDDDREFAVASADDAGPSAIDVSSGTSNSAAAPSSNPLPGATPVFPAAEVTFVDQSVDWEPSAPVGSSLDLTSAGLRPTDESASAAAPNVSEPPRAISGTGLDPEHGESPANGAIGPVAAVPTAEVLPPRTQTGSIRTANATQAGAPLPRTIQSGRQPWYRSGFFALGAVLALIFAVVIVVRRYVPSVRAMSGGALKVISRVHLSPKQSVALVQVGPRLILIGVTPDRLTPLGEISDPQEVSDLRTRAGVGADSGLRTRFEEALASEAVQYEAAQQEAEPLPASEQTNGSPDNTPRVQETLGQLRTLVTQLRSLQQSTK
jgi:flagellar biosynthetic protein FliO